MIYKVRSDKTIYLIDKPQRRLFIFLYSVHGNDGFMVRHSVYYLVNYPLVATKIRRFGHIVPPFVLIGLGIYIFAEVSFSSSRFFRSMHFSLYTCNNSVMQI